MTDATWAEYRAELVKVRGSLDATLRDLRRDLGRKQAWAWAGHTTARIEEATGYLHAGFRSLDVALDALEKAGRP